MSAEIIDMKDWKYGKIAREFIRLRNISPSDAARYAKEQVSAEEFSILSKYIKLELMRNGEFEPHEGQ